MMHASARRHLNWSPEPQLGTHTAEVFRHDPYKPNATVYGYAASVVPQVPHFAEPEATMMPAPEFATSFPEGTRHPSLWGKVSFVPFPAESFVQPVEALPPAGAPLVRVFLGQLPYFVTDMELAWMAYYLGGGNAVMWPERIMKRQSGGERLPTGCIHGYATPEAIATMAARMHKRMLVDDTGVWHAQDEEELVALSAYVASMKSDKTKRVPGRPYDTVVVQEATSNFVPACPVPLTEFPTDRSAVKVPRATPPAYVPPPAYQQFSMDAY